MICEAIYDSLDAIPEALRDEFVQVNGKWQLKDSAIPGVGPLFNAALAANEKKAVGQVKTRNERITNLERENTELEEKVNAAADELAVYKAPGSKVLSKDDADLFDSYTKLGTPKDLETKLTEFDTLKTTVDTLQRSSTLSEVATKGGLNSEVLNDWASTDPNVQGVDFFVKTVTTEDNGKDVTAEVPYARVEKEEGGKKITVEVALLDYAKEKMPAWKYEALTKTSDDKGDTRNNDRRPKATGVQMPNLGSASGGAAPPSTDGKRAVDRFNAERAAKSNPLLPTAAKAG